MWLFLRRSLAVLLWGLVLPALVLVTLAPAALPVLATKDAVLSWWYDVPSPVGSVAVPQRSTIVDAKGNFLAEVYLYNRVVVSPEQVSPLIKQAVLAVEDQRFYQHPGVDVEGLGRAMLANLRNGSWVQGGSTITQQYVKNMAALQDITGRPDLAWQAASEKTLDRKLREARTAMVVERTMGKDAILADYLNAASFGNRTYGVESASRFYFNKSAADVTLPEAAMLAGLLQSPSAYDPLRKPQMAAKRRGVVLGRMLDVGAITREQFLQANRAALPENGTPPPARCGQSYAPFYCAWIEEELLKSPLLGTTPEERRQRLAEGGLVIHTALDPDVQAAAVTAAQRVPTRHRLATAVALVQPGTGHVQALATNRSWGSEKRGQTELLLPTREAFQSGSVFKAFTVAAALDSGLDPDTILPAGVSYESKTMHNPEKGYFSNYSSTPWRNLSIRQALQWSVNTAFVQLQEKVGTTEVARVAHDLGVANLPLEGKNAVQDTEGSLTLGARETSVLNVANAYASIAAGGVACPARGIVYITTTDGNRLQADDGGCRQVVSPAAAAMTTDMLATVVTEGTGKNAALENRPVAGKTGTTNNSAAVWFAGFTPQMAAAVWIGDPRGPSYSVDGALGYESMTGGTVPAEIWKSAMRGALQGLPPLELPGATDQTLIGGPRTKAQQRAGVNESVLSSS